MGVSGRGILDGGARVGGAGLGVLRWEKLGWEMPGEGCWMG